ncbi:MAG: DUF899 domain-containing protein [Acetobacteraceae bacterium]|nr:DUF899 domain-containing protein [Acetobacteraceae bacterium]
MTHQVVSREEWIEARKQHLAREKEFTRLRDELSAERRALPWVKVDKEYAFEGLDGKATLAELFAGRSQLIVYHFMLGADWAEGCKSCSFWADNLQGIDVHLAARDVTLMTVSSAPLERITKFKTRMGWTHKWVSSAGSDFNNDYHVTFTPEELASGDIYYNFNRAKASATERPGISVFYKDADGTVYHTYSCHARGLDMLNGAYHYLDLVPKGRDEANLPYGMAWVRFHDSYGT